jgi:hypothetical protein
LAGLKPPIGRSRVALPGLLAEALSSKGGPAYRAVYRSEQDPNEALREVAEDDRDQFRLGAVLFSSPPLIVGALAFVIQRVREEDRKTADLQRLVAPILRRKVRDIRMDELAGIVRILTDWLTEGSGHLEKERALRRYEERHSSEVQSFESASGLRGTRAWASALVTIELQKALEQESEFRVSDVLAPWVPGLGKAISK